MVRKFKNYKELEKALLEDIKKNMESEVANLVRVKINDGIRELVYGSYSPQIYKRKYRLFDKRNHRFVTLEEKDGKVVTQYFHRAYDENGKDLSKLIILGQDGAKAYSDAGRYNDKFIKSYIESGQVDDIPFYKPRNFIQHAKSNLKKSEIVNALKK